jgi:hypothetical protein
MASRSYRAGTVEALITWSKGTCYWPNCAAPMVLLVEKRPMVNLDIAHIRGLKFGGPRHDASMTPEQLNSFYNLMLLCRPHHRQVDQVAPDKYTVAMLTEWKRIAEPENREELDFLDGMNDDRLQAVLSKVIIKYSADIKSALDELKMLALEQGGILQNLVKKLDEAVMRPDFADAEQVTMLNSAAGRLSSLLFEDNVSNLSEAARKLQETVNEDSVASLNDSADKLRHLPQTIESIYSLQDSLNLSSLVGLPDLVARLERIARRLPGED